MIETVIVCINHVTHQWYCIVMLSELSELSYWEVSIFGSTQTDWYLKKNMHKKNVDETLMIGDNDWRFFSRNHSVNEQGSEPFSVYWFNTL